MVWERIQCWYISAPLQPLQLPIRHSRLLFLVSVGLRKEHARSCLEQMARSRLAGAGENVVMEKTPAAIDGARAVR